MNIEWSHVHQVLTESCTDGSPFSQRSGFDRWIAASKADGFAIGGSLFALGFGFNLHRLTLLLFSLLFSCGNFSNLRSDLGLLRPATFILFLSLFLLGSTRVFRHGDLSCANFSLSLCFRCFSWTWILFLAFVSPALSFFLSFSIFSLILLISLLSFSLAFSTFLLISLLRFLLICLLLLRPSWLLLSVLRIFLFGLPTKLLQTGDWLLENGWIKTFMGCR